MTTALLSLAALVLQLIVFYSIGILILKARGMEGAPLPSALLTGYLGYFTVFEVLCFVCEVLIVPLHVLTAVTAVLCGAAVIAAHLTCRSLTAQEWAGRRIRRRRHGIWLYVLSAVIVLSCLFALLYTDASADSEFYVGTASTAVFTDTIGRFDPTTGQSVKAFLPRYAFSLYPYHNAVMAQLFHIPAIVQARSVMSVINVLCAQLSLYVLGLSLFSGREKTGAKVLSIEESPETVRVRRADMFVLAAAVLNAFSATIYLPGMFLLTRSYEGKSLIANICTVLVLALCADFYSGRNVQAGPGAGTSGGCPAERRPFADLFLILAAGVCFSASVIIPAALLWAAMLPLLIVRRKASWIGKLVLSSIPVILWVVLYWMAAHRVFVMTAYR